jgi:phosphatidylglycerophosphate synthase
MKLQQFDRSADWQAIPHNERSRWQRLAARTYGFVTPANAATVLGIVLVILGLAWVLQGRLVSGLIAVAVGRLCDVLDGFLARLTHTKSSLGESLDAGFDKVAVFCAGAVFAATHIIPLIVIGVIAVQQLAVFGMGAYAKAHHSTLHPSKEGKYTTVIIWLAVIVYLLAACIGQNHAGYESLRTIGVVCALIVAGMGGVAVVRYSKALRIATTTKA